jgi:hypothetical protein
MDTITRKHFDSLGMVHLVFPDGTERAAWPVDARDFMANGARLVQPPKGPVKGEEPPPAPVALTDEQIEAKLAEEE